MMALEASLDRVETSLTCLLIKMGRVRPEAALAFTILVEGLEGPAKDAVISIFCEATQQDEN